MDGVARVTGHRHRPGLCRVAELAVAAASAASTIQPSLFKTFSKSRTFTLFYALIITEKAPCSN